MSGAPDMDNLIYLGSKTIYLVLALSAVPVAVATAVGLVVALIQAVTHLQEQTLPFGIKLIAVCFTIYLMMGWMSTRVGAFADEAFRLALQ